jgi:hypothetical protein
VLGLGRGKPYEEKDPYADFVVHEMAHIFHNCKRRTVGLKQTRKREWLLDIAFVHFSGLLTENEQNQGMKAPSKGGLQPGTCFL